MSVTFSVGNKKIIDGKTWIVNDENVNQDTLFTFSMDRVRLDPSGRISDLIDSKYGGDISYHFYEEESRLKRAGKPYGKTLNEWISIFSEFGKVNADSEHHVYNITDSYGGEIMLSVYPVRESDKYEIQMSNTNAHTILTLLGLVKGPSIESQLGEDSELSRVFGGGLSESDWYTGTIEPEKLLSAIDGVSGKMNLIQEFTRKPYKYTNDGGLEELDSEPDIPSTIKSIIESFGDSKPSQSGGVNIYGGGIDNDYIMRQLSALERLAAYAITKRYEYVTWG